MRLFGLLIVFSLVAVVGVAQVPGLTWAKGFSGPERDRVEDIATDAAGNVYSVGTFAGTVDFDPNAGVSELTSTSGSLDAYVTKVDGNGNLVWARSIGGDADDYAYSVTVSANGNVVMAGSYSGVVDFDPDPANFFNVSSTGPSDGYVLILKSNGDFERASVIGVTGFGYAGSVVTDASNNIYVAGSFEEGIAFDGALPDITGIGLADIFLIKFAPNGAYVWAKYYGGLGNDNGTALHLDGSDLYMASSFEGEAADPGGFFDYVSHGNYDILLTKSDTDGNLLLTSQIGGNSQDLPTSLTVSGGNIYLLGNYQNTVDFNPLGTPFNLTVGGSDDFIARYNSSFVLNNWAFGLGLGGGSGAEDMTVDASGNLLITGYYQLTIDFDPGVAEHFLTAEPDNINMFVWELDQNRNYIWAQGFGGYIDDYGAAITLDGSGNIYVAGTYSANANYATGICADGNLVNANEGNEDIFLLKFDPNVAIGSCFGITEQPDATVTACSGSEFTLTCVGVGAENLTYQWQMLDGAVWENVDDDTDPVEPQYGFDGATTSTLIVGTSSTTGTFNFRCVVSGDGVPDAISNESTVTVLAAGPATHVVANSGCGESQYMLTASGGTDGQYRWYEGGVLIDGAVNHNYTTSLINTPTIIEVSSFAGCEGTKIQVRINPDDCASTPGLVWAERTASESLATITSMTVDKATGDVYLAGRFFQTVDFDPGPGVNELTATGSGEGYVSRTNANGDLVWVYQSGGISIGALELDGLGNLYFGGSFTGAVNFDFKTATAPRTSISTLLGGADMYIAKMNTDATFAWVTAMNGTNGKGTVTALASDALGNNIHATGNFQGTIDIDPGTPNVPRTSASAGADIFVMKLSSAGPNGFQWGYKMGSTGLVETGRAIEVDGSGNVYTTGYFQLTPLFDPQAGGAPLASSGATDIFIQKLTSTGAYIWAGKMGGTASDFSYDMELDVSNNVYITGSFNGTADFDPGAASVNMTTAGQVDAFAAKLNSSGVYQWAKRMGGSQGQEANSIALDASANVYITGYTAGSGDFDPGAGTYNLTSIVDEDAFVEQLDEDGNFGWAYSMGSVGASFSDNNGARIAVDGTGNIYVAGSYYFTSDFDPGHCTFALSTDDATAPFLQKVRAGVFSICFNIQPNDVAGCSGVTQTLTAEATGTTNILYQWQLFNPLTGLYEDVVDGGGYSGATTSQLTIDTSGDFGAGTYQCHVTGDNAPDKDSPSAVVTVSPKPSAPGVTGATACSPGQQTLTATGSTDGNYVWYDEDSNVIAGEVNGTYVTPFITATTFYYVSIKVAGCEGDATEVDAVINITVTAPVTTGNSSCSAPASLLLSATGGTNGQYRWYASPTDPTPLAGEVNSTYTTPSISTTTSYYVSINDGSCESPRTQVDAVISPTPDPGVTPGSRCDPGVVTLTATGSVDGNYLWYSVATGGTPIAGEVNGTYNTPSLSTTTTFYASISIGTCESGRVPVDAIILSTSGPSVTGASSCGPAAVTLTAAGAAAGQYRWYTASTGGTAIAGEQNDTYVTPSVSTTTSYFVSIDNGSCESGRSEVIATINTPPAAPTTTGNTTCGSGTLLLTAAGATNGQYRWYTQASGGVAISGEVNSTYTTPSISATTDYYVSINNGTCESTRAVVTATITTCTTNQPPVISAASTNAVVQGNASINLIPLLSDPDNNLDLSSLTIIVQPKSGAVATIDNGVLKVNYTGVAFIGTDELTIEVCDMSGSCVQRVITIEVAGGVVVYNAVSPNGDGKNDVFYLDAIDFQESTKTNHVKIFNRWGDLVFDVENYDNKDRVFTGKSNDGKELTSGTYYYKVEFAVGAPQTGYLTLKR